jgi:tRNA threonylcarbamoyladenosine biosynthesis protein TsaB
MENLFGALSMLLDESSFSFADVDRVAIALGPGSFTGIRIGLATALGLQTALSIRCLGVSLLDSLFECSGAKANCISAVSMGRSGVCVMIVDASGCRGPSHVMSTDGFLNLLCQTSGTVALDPSLLRTVKQTGACDAISTRVADCGSNLAMLVGRSIVSAKYSTDRLEPIFASAPSIA